MFKKSQKNYLELNMRVSYDPQTDSINITSKDKNLPANSDGFRLTLNSGRGAEQTLREMLEDAGVISEEHIIPTMLPYEDIAPSPWDEFPLGKAGGSVIATWNPTSSPHLLLSGPAGMGKSVIERNLIFHCLQHPGSWRVIGIDLHRVELSPYKKYAPVVERIATELGEAVETCRLVKDEMMNRYTQMEKLGINNYRDLPDSPRAIMFLVDSVSALVEMSGIKNEEGIAEDKLKSEASMILNNIARLGRSAGVHLVLACQRPDTSVINRELKRNLNTRIVMGRVDAIHSRIALDNEEATHIPSKIKGRGYIQNYGSGHQFQAAFAPLDWYDELLSKNPHLKWVDPQAAKGE
jgi:DNA segregation ATPase FtsK/SpoIIIE-like protein